MALKGSAAEPRMTRATDELGAAVDGMEKAAQKILKCSEAIDENARTLAATLKTDYERGLAQDIQEQMMRIYEACNFQDLAGQRIGKVIATLQTVEEHVARMIALSDGSGARSAACRRACRTAGQRPEARRRSGHASQSDIDATVRLVRTSNHEKANKRRRGKQAASASAARSDVSWTTNAMTRGATACMSRKGPASRPISRP